MKKLIITFIGMLLLFSCQGQIVKKNKGLVKQDYDSSAHVIDPIDWWPFEIKRKTMYAVLPDSLGGKKGKGMSVLSININEKGTIEIFTIIKLSICEGKRKIIDYWGGSYFRTRKDYPSNVLRYYPFFEKYVNSLKIVPIVGVKPKSENIFTVVVRF